VSWLKGDYDLSLKKSSTVCFTIRCSILAIRLQIILFNNTGKTLCSAQWLVFDAKLSLELSCQPTHCNPDIMLSCLCALYSQFLAMMEYFINIHENYQETFNDVVNKPPIN
jgi:hypothetical protein